MRIRITAGNHVVHAELYENEASEKWYESLPVTYLMMNLYDREMCYRMGNGSLPVKKAVRKNYRTGDISYRPPAGSLVILYGQNGEIFKQEPIGHIEDDISFFQGMNDTEMTFEKEDD